MQFQQIAQYVEMGKKKKKKGKQRTTMTVSSKEPDKDHSPGPI